MAGSSRCREVCPTRLRAKPARPRSSPTCPCRLRPEDQRTLWDKNRRSWSIRCLAERMSFQPAKNLGGVGIGREDLVEDMLDDPVAYDQSEAFDQPQAAGLEGRQPERVGESEARVTEQRERKSQSLSDLMLIVAELCGKA